MWGGAPGLDLLHDLPPALRREHSVRGDLLPDHGDAGERERAGERRRTGSGGGAEREEVDGLGLGDASRVK